MPQTRGIHYYFLKEKDWRCETECFETCCHITCANESPFSLV